MEGARLLFEEALAIARAVGHRRTQSMTLCNPAILQQNQGRMARARSLYEEALAIARDVGNRPDEGWILGNLARLHQAQGRMEEARTLYEEALAIHREVGDRRSEGIVIGNIAAWELLVSGDSARAADLSAQGETLFREVGDKPELGKLLCTHDHIQLAGGESGDQDVGIKREPQEMRSNTSSSVKIPRSCAFATPMARSSRNRRSNR